MSRNPRAAITVTVVDWDDDFRRRISLPLPAATGHGSSGTAGVPAGEKRVFLSFLRRADPGLSHPVFLGGNLVDGSTVRPLGQVNNIGAGSETAWFTVIFTNPGEMKPSRPYPSFEASFRWNPGQGGAGGEPGSRKSSSR